MRKHDSYYNTGPRSAGHKQHAFTLIELLVVFAIISVLAAMLLPAFQAARQKAKYARWLVFKSNLRCDPNLIAYYTFERGEGEKEDILENMAVGGYADLRCAPSKLNGRIVSGSWKKNMGRWRGKNTLEFDGRYDYVELGGGTWGVLTWKELTIEAWVYVLDTTRFFQAFVSSAEAGEFAHFQFFTVGNIVVYGSPCSYIFRIISPFPLLTWRHVALTAKDGEGRLYEDGIIVDSISKVITGASYIRQPTTALYIGCGYHGDRPFHGRIDEVAIYNRALTEAEIQGHYKMGRP